MKLYIFILLILAFLQSSFVPLNLCLLLLICRSYALHQQTNYYLALIAGVFLSILSAANLGFWPLVLIAAVFVIHFLRLLPITARFLTVVPVSFLVLLIISWVESQLMNTPFVFWYPVLSSLLALPLYIVIREWEDRFVAKPGIKLRV